MPQISQDNCNVQHKLVIIIYIFFSVLNSSFSLHIIFLSASFCFFLLYFDDDFFSSRKINFIVICLIYSLWNVVCFTFALLHARNNTTTIQMVCIERPRLLQALEYVDT